jgi:hypothetical protein
MSTRCILVGFNRRPPIALEELVDFKTGRADELVLSCGRKGSLQRF